MSNENEEIKDLKLKIGRLKTLIIEAESKAEKKDLKIHELNGSIEQLHVYIQETMVEVKGKLSVQTYPDQEKWDLICEHWEDLTAEDLRSIIKVTLRV